MLQKYILYMKLGKLLFYILFFERWKWRKQWDKNSRISTWYQTKSVVICYKHNAKTSPKTLSPMWFCLATKPI